MVLTGIISIEISLLSYVPKSRGLCSITPMGSAKVGTIMKCRQTSQRKSFERWHLDTFG
jgi:hypothetical protein